MCGIAGGFVDEGVTWKGVHALRHRGPDAEGVVTRGLLSMGHARLSILDLDPRSDQPFVLDDLALCYNGELWNYVELREELCGLGREFKTAGDTEVVAAALLEWGEAALPRMEGMFALAWTIDGDRAYLARDRFGEVPLHCAAQWPFMFASEVKGLLKMGAHPSSVQWVKPGTVVEATPGGMVERRWYDTPAFPAQVGLNEAARVVRSLVQNGCVERTISDVPVCTLLSGGIDSAAVAVFLARELPGLVAYIAVYDPKSRDLRCAREVAERLGITLREVRVEVPSADDLAGVVRMIEMPHKAQVEIGWPCLKLAEVMRADGFKVTFSGEGSDELWASYGFAYHALKKNGWYGYRKRLYVGQHRKNFARCNKIFMAHSVECRLPFLHRPLAEYALSLPKTAVQSGKNDKAIMSEAMRGLLPSTVINRPKMVFQDGMGMKQAIAGVIADPRRFYGREHAKQYSR